MYYIFSILIAVIGVGFSILPYLVMTKIIFQLIDGSKDWSLYLRECGFMALFWLCRCVCHSISTTLSHVGTFNVLANIKNRCMEKFPKLPLGDVLERSSGSIKNVICERVDSIETTLAHVFPEFTAGICGALAIYVIIFTTNWKLGLISIGTLPLGIIFYCLMCVGYQESFARCVKSTKNLNDTAVEYINGIEVIKAFGQHYGPNYQEKIYRMIVSNGIDDMISYLEKKIGVQSSIIDEFHSTEEEQSKKIVPVDELLKSGIRDLDLSVRSCNCLLRRGIGTVSDLIKLNVSDLSKIRNMGNKGIQEIIDFVHGNGLFFADEVPVLKVYLEEIHTQLDSQSDSTLLQKYQEILELLMNS